MSVLGVLVVALLSTTPGAGGAQGEASAALGRIRSGALIRVDLAGGERIEGRLRSVTADSLLLAGPSGDRRVGLHQIEELHERGRATNTAAIVGAVAGGAAGGTVITVACAIGRSDDGVIGNEEQWVDCALVGGALGGAAGAGIGASIGSLIPKWHVRYRSRR